MDFTVILVLYIFLLPSARLLSELDFAHILSSTTQTGLWKLPRLWCLSLACVMQTALELVEDDVWEGGVKEGNEAAFQRWFMNCLSFSLNRQPGCSCFGQIPDLITKTEHMCKILKSGRDSSGKDSSIAFWKFTIMVVLCMFFMAHCWKKKKLAALCCIQYQPSVLWEHNG